jgi:Cu+-exporting ATPase
MTSTKLRAKQVYMFAAPEGLGEEVVLLKGDSDVMAQPVGRAAQVDRMIAHCFPEGKVKVVRELLRQGHRVLMVGDSLNDAPAWATASLGLVPDTQGLTAAASAADAVSLSADIHCVMTGVRKSNLTLEGLNIMNLSSVGHYDGPGGPCRMRACIASRGQALQLPQRSGRIFSTHQVTPTCW